MLGLPGRKPGGASLFWESDYYCCPKLGMTCLFESASTLHAIPRTAAATAAAVQADEPGPKRRLFFLAYSMGGGAGGGGVAQTGSSPGSLRALSARLSLPEQALLLLSVRVCMIWYV